MVDEVADLSLLQGMTAIVGLPLQTVFILVLGLLLAKLELVKLGRASCVLIDHELVLALRLHFVVVVQCAVLACLVLEIGCIHTVIIVPL